MTRDLDEVQMKRLFVAAACRRFDVLATAFRARRSGFCAPDAPPEASGLPYQNLPSRRGT